MKRKLFALLTALLLLLAIPLSVFAAEGMSYVIDAAGLFTAEERDALEEKALALRDAYQMDIVILTVNSLDGYRPQDYADDFYDANGYGYDENYSGMLFLLSMEERDYYISTDGNARYVLTDYGIQATAEEALPYLSVGDYYGGFNAWLDTLPQYFDAYGSGASIDGYADYAGDYYHGSQEDILYYEEDSTPSFFLSLLIGLIAAGVSVFAMRSGMNTKRAQSSAVSYLQSGSYHLRTQRDLFLYSNVTKTPRPTQNSSGPGGFRGGGSSIHTSSGGHSHGGGGGKF